MKQCGQRIDEGGRDLQAAAGDYCAEGREIGGHASDAEHVLLAPRVAQVKRELCLRRLREFKERSGGKRS